MKLRHLWAALALLLLLCLALGTAAGESARVLTPGGKLNVRKSASDKSKLVSTIPNRSLVEVEEVDGDWARISYKKVTGWVRISYLKLPSTLVGRTVYSDGGTLLLRERPGAEAPIIAAVGQREAVIVLSVADGWAQVQTLGDLGTGAIGYVEAVSLSYQLETPAGGVEWLAQEAVMTAAASLTQDPDAASPALTSLSAGQAVTVGPVVGDRCLVLTEDVCGYVPVSKVCLSGVAEEEAVADSNAAAAASAALKKQFKAFSKENLYYLVATAETAAGLTGPLSICSFLSDAGQVRYGALVDAQGKAVFLGDYTAFAAPVEQESLLPEGLLSLALSADTLPIGGVLDITVQSWSKHQVTYSLLLDGKKLVSSEPSSHLTASYRPRKAGNYTLKITVKDAKGKTASETAEFTVTDEIDTEIPDIYSQKDGWWHNKAYRKSDLAQSGCAIFALSHALQRMGKASESTQPERLAKTYALCLTSTGTNNERLIRSAAEDYGFTTQRDLINSKEKIRELLEAGCMFSFSIARGHIALISGISSDGTMVRIVDSAPTATFERIVNTSIYFEGRSGGYRVALSLSDVPGARWYFETDHYGGLEYWMTLEYAAKRGVRLIQP